jgi:uncharacterized protein (DUF488 family)
VPPTIRAIAHNGIVVDEFEVLITDPHAVIFNKKSYKKLFDEYETTLPDREEALNQVLALQKKYQRIALTCFEKSLFKNTLNTKINHSAILFADKKRQ